MIIKVRCHYEAVQSELTIGPDRDSWYPRGVIISYYRTNQRYLATVHTSQILC